MSYDLNDYAQMFSDEVRGGAYLAAVREVVRPGMVVADIGAGPGVLGVYAAMLGARRVFLVEPDLIVDAAVALAEENGVGDRIEIVREVSTNITLPELADVIISDLRGVLPLFGGHLEAAADMRARLLAPGGICIPRRDRMRVALVEDVVVHGLTAGAWDCLDSVMAHQSLTRLIGNHWYRTHATQEQLVSPPMGWVTLDYDLPAPPLRGDFAGDIIRDGTAHGLLCWFDADLTETVRLDNAPGAPRALYGQAFFPFATAIRVTSGDAVAGRLHAVQSSGEYQWAWTVTLRRNGTAIGEARHASLFGTPLLAETLSRRTGAFVPVQTSVARALEQAIALVDGHRSLDEIAATLALRLPGDFPSAHDALRFLTQHDHLWR